MPVLPRRGGPEGSPPHVELERAVPWAVVLLVGGFVLWHLYPSRLLRNTTPVQSDIGGHFFTALQHREDPQFIGGFVPGWSQAWFTGYPVVTFYFPLGAALAVALSLVVPLAVAFKIVVALGPLLLPFAAYLFGRLHGRDRLNAACYAVTVIPMLLEPLIYVAGGSIGAGVNGEYSYGLSLSLGLLVLGFTGAGLRTGRYRAVTSALLAATILLHLLPSVLVVWGIIVFALLEPSRARARWTITVLGTAAALVCFWMLPFVTWSNLTGGRVFDRAGPVLTWLFPVGMAVVGAIAVVTALMSVIAAAAGVEKVDRLRIAMVLMAVSSAAVFASTPAGRVWNARFLPVWFLWVSLLAGDGLAWLARIVDERRRRLARGRTLAVPALAGLLTPVAAFAAIVPVWATRLGGGLLRSDLRAYATAANASFGGYELSPDHAEYEAFFTTVGGVMKAHGCGRAHWEWDTGSWTAGYVPLMHLLPHRTQGCITVTEGLYTQSSPTASYIRLVNSRLSADPVDPEPGIVALDLARGVADLRVLGVRYFFAAQEETQEAADASPQLRFLAATNPHSEGRIWKIYEVVDAVELVEPLPHLPVVVTGSGRSRRSWERTVDDWAGTEDHGDVVVAASGPSEWPRREDLSLDVPRRTTEAVTITDVHLSDRQISFQVSLPGTPVLVRMSYFPRWRARGAEGPWRVTPNQMVVVPKSRTVELRYERTTVDRLGWLGTLAGVGGVVFLALRPPVAMPEPPLEVVEERPKRRSAKKPKRKNRRR